MFTRAIILASLTLFGTVAAPAEAGRLDIVARPGAIEIAAGSTFDLQLVLRSDGWASWHDSDRMYLQHPSLQIQRLSCGYAQTSVFRIHAPRPVECHLDVVYISSCGQRVRTRLPIRIYNPRPEPQICVPAPSTHRWVNVGNTWQQPSWVRRDQDMDIYFQVPSRLAGVDRFRFQTSAWTKIEYVRIDLRDGGQVHLRINPRVVSPGNPWTFDLPSSLAGREIYRIKFRINAPRRTQSWVEGLVSY